MSLLPRSILRLLPLAQQSVWYFAPISEKAVALTIDDSPDPNTTDSILQMLERHSVPATFFITGDYVGEFPGALERIHGGGHELANHLMADSPAIRLSSNMFENKLLECDSLIRSFGDPKFFRPPSGFYTSVMVETARRHGYTTVLADAFPLDTLITIQRLRRVLLRWLVRPGSIIVLHDRAERGRRTVITLDWLLPELLARGYKFFRLSGLFSLQRSKEER